jgi:2-keto-4-pentenoate hydratase
VPSIAESPAVWNVGSKGGLDGRRNQVSGRDFWRARGRGEYFPTAYEDRLSLDEAYRIQLALIDRRVAAGERHIGWKVGLTSKAIQEQFGFHEPVFGCIFQSFPSGHELPPNLIKPGFETELCMRFARSLQGEVMPQQVMDALEGIHPSFEIIETRGDLTRHIALALTDNAQQHSVILGPPRRPDASTRLDQVTARIKLSGKEIGHWGRGPWQPAQLRCVAGSQADRVWPHHPTRRHRDDGLVRAAVPACPR